MKKNRRDHRKEVRDWALRDGPNKVILTLANAGISIAMAQKLAAGRYTSVPKIDAVEVIEEVMKSVKQGKVS